jgi:perosamine synthetase
MIPIAEPSLNKEELENVTEAVKSGWISSIGYYIKEFEEKFAQYSNRKHGITTSNGTVALHLALEALNIKKGDEVIIPGLTFIATANVVKYCNAKPVFADSHPDYWCIDPKKIEEKITNKTKAIIPVHLYGHPCDMGWIQDIAEDNELYIIEDAAEAHGAEYKGKKVGSFGDISCFSFYGNKIITTGEGGMCLTDNDELADKMRILRDHGMNPEKRYWYDVIGFNYRMTNLQAAVGLAQLNKLDNFVEKKRRNAKEYRSKLNEFKEDGLIKLHPEMSWAKCVYWMYSILIEDKFGINRDELIEKLGDMGIDTRPFFYLINTMPHFKNSERMPVAEELSKRGINLPSSVTLNNEDISKIAKSIGEIK